MEYSATIAQAADLLSCQCAVEIHMEGSVWDTVRSKIKKYVTNAKAVVTILPIRKKTCNVLPSLKREAPRVGERL